MSNWPQAVWIVKSLQQNFGYKDLLIEMKAKAQQLETKVDATVGKKASFIKEADGQNPPNPPQDSILFILREDNSNQN